MVTAMLITIGLSAISGGAGLHIIWFRENDTPGHVLMVVSGLLGTTTVMLVVIHFFQTFFAMADKLGV